MKNQKGFTLVELLVVIAIIAVLSAVAVVNLNSARNKGVDASRQANLASFPAAGEIYYDDTSLSYLGFCADPSLDGVEASILASGGVLNCDDEATAWAAEVDLEEGGFFCVDSTGQSKEHGVTKGGATTVCL